MDDSLEDQFINENAIPLNLSHFLDEDPDPEDEIIESAVEVNSALDEQTYTFHNCTVVFPYKAYPSQEQMMEKLIKGAEGRQHCLLESPTGTGKTAALLCALLAWQLREEKESSGRRLEEQSNGGEGGGPSVLPSPSKKLKVSEDAGEKDAKGEDTESGPLIYYATRTHSQIKGVVAQLSKTAYKNTPMMILASRNQTCINSHALNSDRESVETICQRFRTAFYKNKGKKGNLKPTCPYYDGPVKEANFAKEDGGPWDIEDLKAYGTECGSCPYEEMRPLQKNAKIIFCTYNHLLHKQIRKALKIKLEGNVVVFDEAHNIEDVCRSIASFQDTGALSLTKIERILFRIDKSMEENVPGEIKSEHLNNLQQAFTRLRNWLCDQLKANSPGYGDGKIYESRRIFKRRVSNLVRELSGIQFGPDQVRELWGNYFVLEDRHYTIQTEDPFKVDPDAMKDISKFLFGLSIFFKKDPTTGEFLYGNDYATFLIKSYEEVPQDQASAFGFAGEAGASSEPEILNPKVELHLLCLNPAIVFKEMKDARSVVVTSGTLSPINSFSSELDTNFELQLSTDHVMSQDRIFSCIISSNSESEGKLVFNYNSRRNPRSRDQTTFQDHQSQLFNIILRISEKVPFGILVFVPSSSFIIELKDEWSRNGNLEGLRAAKDIYFEHENRLPGPFNQMMESYANKVKEPRGAILFAVLRGKISEGVDFKDNAARAVITVGIPFPPCFSDAITTKKFYNDCKYVRILGSPARFLNGDQWYQATTFRALNQAFGRCVRHVRDWGAIVIVDSRFSYNQSYKDYLSKWVRDSLVVPGRMANGSLDQVLPHLASFVGSLL